MSTTLLTQRGLGASGLTSDRAQAPTVAQICGLRVEKITQLKDLEALAPEWRVLSAALSPRLPFTEPEWSLTWWKHFRREQLLFQDRLNAFAVRDAYGSLVAVAPMMISSRPSIGPARVRELQFLGADSNVTELRGVVCRPEDTAEVMAALHKALSAQKSDWDWIQWRGLRAGDGDGRAQVPGLRPTGTVPNYYLQLAETWTEFKAGLPRNVKESLRKCYNSLKRDGHSYSFVAVSTPDAVPAAIDRFLTLHAERAALTATISHPDYFASSQARAFLHDYATRMSQDRAVRVFQLKIDATVVATRVAFLLGREIYLYFSGYDPAWKRYSVMTTLLAEALQWGIANGFQVVNLSMGQDVSKTRWRPEVTMFAEGYEVAPTVRARLAFEAMSRLRRSMRGGILQATTPVTAHV